MSALYAWEVESSGGCGSTGITDERDIASKRLETAMDAMPDGPAEGSSGMSG
ncbi:hypothetical protein LDL08_36610 [Nonomuraea glycinis]|nr:hypothetical protein [Nonomuraea glycinis]MCA2181699.1 hypothetical protein [Nonomuraea glycinis]